jgi:multidrug resistance efflux pump
MRQLLLALAAGGLVLLAYLLWAQRESDLLQVSGFIEADDVRVGSRVGGRVAEVLVEEGQRVSFGQPLLRLDPFDLQSSLAEVRAREAAVQAEVRRLRAGNRPQEIDEARSRRDQARATLERLQAGPRPEEIQISREHLRAAQANLEFADLEHRRIQALTADAKMAPTELAEAVRRLKESQAAAAAAAQELALLEAGTRREEIDEALALLAQAEHALALLEAGFREEDLARAEAELAAASARAAAIEIQIAELEVTAPCDCVVEAIDLLRGDLVAAGAPTVELLDTTRLWVRAYIPQARLGGIALGQPAVILTDSWPGQRFKARLTFIASEAEFTPRNVQTPEERSKQVFRIKATLEEGLDRLRAGMAADVLLEPAAVP